MLAQRLRCSASYCSLLYFSSFCQHAVESFLVGGHDVDDGELAEGVLLGLLSVGYRLVTDELLDDLAPVGRVRYQLDGRVEELGVLIREFGQFGRGGCCSRDDISFSLVIMLQD